MAPIWHLIVSLSLAQFSGDVSVGFPEQARTGNVQPQWGAASNFAATSELTLPDSIVAPPDVADFELAADPDAVRTPAWGVAATYIAAHGDKGLGLVDLGLNRTWRLGQDSHPIIVAPGLGVHWFEEPAWLELPSTVYDAYVDLSWRVLNGGFAGVTLEVVPGFYSDLQRIEVESFQVTGCIMGDYCINPQWTVVGGVAVVRQLESHWLPVGGLLWIPHEDWQCEVTIPRPRLARRIHQTHEVDVWAYLSGQFGGGAWAVDDGADDIVLLGYSDLRLLAGVNLWRGSGRELSCEIGYAFSRDVSVSDTSVYSPHDAWLVQAVWIY